MRINKDYEREINLRDLFFELLYHWRSILLAALIGALVLSAFQFAKVTLIHKEGKLTKEERQYEIDLQNYHDSVANAENKIKVYTKLLKEQNDYLDNSLYMALDSQNEWYAKRTYFVKMSQAVLEAMPENMQEDPADYVAAAYVSNLIAGIEPSELEALMGTSVREYINELVTISSDPASNNVVVRVIGPDEETVARQMTYFSERMQMLSEMIAQNVGAHEMTLVSDDLIQRIDPTLSSMQDEINHKIADWQKSLVEQRITLNDLEDDEEPEKPGMHLKLFIAIGFILGAFLLAVILILKYLLANKLRAGSELKKHYELPVYGEFNHSRAKHSEKGLDKLFEKWEFAHSAVDVDSVYNTICALIEDKCSGKSVLLTGTVSISEIEKIGDNLRKRLTSVGNISMEGDFLNNASAITEAKRADAVILVEQKHVSCEDDIEREVELLLCGGANVMGSIAY